MSMTFVMWMSKILASEGNSTPSLSRETLESPKIPPKRPFLAPTISIQQPKLLDFLPDEYKLAIDGKPKRQ